MMGIGIQHESAFVRQTGRAATSEAAPMLEVFFAIAAFLGKSVTIRGPKRRKLETAQTFVA